MGEQARIVQVDTGVDVWCSVWEADGPTHLPVLLLHGLSQQRAFWHPVVRALRTRPVAAIDQRAHGNTDTPLGTDVSITACARDVHAVLDALGWERCVLVGHSWGAAVALAATARIPHRVASSLLVDGGLWSPAALGPRADVRRMLEPPALGVAPDDLWRMIGSGALSHRPPEELRDALGPTFVTGPDGLLRTRIGRDRHMAVLDGLLDHDLEADLAAAAAAGSALWAVVCDEPGSTVGNPWRSAKEAGVARMAAVPGSRLLRWGGAVHDVPLQWPELVAALVDTVVGEVEGS